MPSRGYIGNCVTAFCRNKDVFKDGMCIYILHASTDTLCVYIYILMYASRLVCAIMTQKHAEI